MTENFYPDKAEAATGICDEVTVLMKTGSIMLEDQFMVNVTNGKKLRCYNECKC